MFKFVKTLVAAQIAKISEYVDRRYEASTGFIKYPPVDPPKDS